MSIVKRLCVVVGIAACVAWPATTQAAVISYQVVLDTSSLSGSPLAPFSIDFQLIDGGGGATNTVQLTDFDFGGGSANGTPTTFGGATGDTATSIELTDAGPSFFNAFTQAFSPGSFLQFLVTMTTDPELDPAASPDRFSFAILDSFGVPLPTTDFTGAIFSVDLAANGPVAAAFGSDPQGGGPEFSEPRVRAVPEPAMAWLAVTTLAGLTLRRRTA